MGWFGHVARNDGCINSITAVDVDGHRGRGRPRKTLGDTINDDRKNWKLTRVDPAKRIEWRKKNKPEQTWEPCDPLLVEPVR